MPTRFARLTALIPVLLAVLLCVQFAAALRGHVIGITDGDTLTVLTNRWEEVRVRLAEVDTPDRWQPYRIRGPQFLSDLSFGRSVRVAVQDTDRYGRAVGRVC